MKVNIYIKLENYNDGDFDVSNDYYKSDEDFFNAMDKENKKYSNVAYEALSNLGNIVKEKTVNYGSLSNSTKSAVANNYKSEAILLDENGKDETVDNIIKNCFSNDVVINIIKFNRDSMDEEFEEDYNFWVDEHNSINQYKDKIGEDKVWKNEPTRTLYIEFLNNANEKTYVMFENCKILDKGDMDEYAILAEKVKLIDKL